MVPGKVSCTQAQYFIFGNLPESFQIYRFDIFIGPFGYTVKSRFFVQEDPVVIKTILTHLEKKAAMDSGV